MLRRLRILALREAAPPTVTPGGAEKIG
jgi:hypothetical protein